MWADSFSCVRKEASTAESRSLCSGAMVCVTITGMRPLFVVLAVQLVIALVFVALVATDNLPFTGDGDGEAAPSTAAEAANRFDGPAAFDLLKLHLSYGPRPGGSQQSRKLGKKRRGLMRQGRFQKVPHGLRNVVGIVPGRDPPKYIVVGAPYDTKDQSGFLGANDGPG